MSITSYHVGQNRLESCDPDPIDPRGILWMWEEPSPRASYVIGVDPTFGIAQWNRSIRTRDDIKVDNAAIEVFRVGGDRPDVQVAEFVAPTDAESLAAICNFIGRLYGGNHEEGQALMCIEVFPGTGWMTQRELISRFGYFNLPPWTKEGGGITLKVTPHLGWQSSRQSRQELWSRGVTHLSKKLAVLHSQWLVEEMADCSPDSFLAVTGRARYGLHDDRVVAALLAIWYANEWSLDINPTDSAPLENSNAPDYQACAISAAAMIEDWNERFSNLMESGE